MTTRNSAAFVPRFSKATSSRSFTGFRGSSLFLAEAVEWLLSCRNADGFWDWGPQVKDPWGYFGYFSTNRDYKHNRTVDCTMEILNFLKKYMDNNTD
jgi:hypothetical protein